MPQINSFYASTQAPHTVKVWEEQIENADTTEDAQLQMLYHLALQARTIKQLLFWVMVVVPVVAIVGLIVLSNVVEPDPGF